MPCLFREQFLGPRLVCMNMWLRKILFSNRSGTHIHACRPIHQHVMCIDFLLNGVHAAAKFLIKESISMRTIRQRDGGQVEIPCLTHLPLNSKMLPCLQYSTCPSIAMIYSLLHQSLWRNIEPFLGAYGSKICSTNATKMSLFTYCLYVCVGRPLLYRQRGKTVYQRVTTLIALIC